MHEVAIELQIIELVCSFEEIQVPKQHMENIGIGNVEEISTMSLSVTALGFMN